MLEASLLIGLRRAIFVGVGSMVAAEPSLSA